MEVTNYKNYMEFADAHGELDEEGEASLGDLVKSVAESELKKLAERVKLSVDPYEIWFKPSEKEQYTRDVIAQWSAADEERPGIETLNFQPLPASKANGLKAKLFAGEWNKFVEEIEGGRVEYAEVLFLDSEDAKGDGGTDAKYYVKVADLDGNVIRGCVCSLKPSNKGYYDRGGWIGPDEYMYEFPERTEEEFEEYELYFWAHACQDPVDPSERKHAYILHYNFKGTEYYGAIFENEFNNLKELKGYITMTSPENQFKYNNYEPVFSW